jgi:hypothetical protein
MRLSRWLSWGSIVLGLIGAVWIWQHPAPDRMRRSLAWRIDFPDRAGMPFMDPYRRVRGPSVGMYGIPERTSRYLANLSTEVGDYVVSVRQVFGGRSVQSLYVNPPLSAPSTPMGSSLLTLQIMSASPKAMRRVRDFAVNLHIADDAGRPLKATSVYLPVAFEHGLARRIDLSEPSPNARYLQYLEGEILLSEPEEADRSSQEEADSREASARNLHRLKFRIDTIPLPVMTHVFGVGGANYVEPSQTQGLGAFDGLQVLTGARASALRHLFPPYVPDSGPLQQPMRLLMQPDLPNSFRVYLPLPEMATTDNYASLQCSLTPRIKQDGEIALEGTILAPDSTVPVRVAFSVWDNEPVALVLPRRAGAKEAPRTVLWLCLYLEMPPRDPVGTSATARPFPAHRGEIGGAIAGQALAGEKPLRFGRAVIDVSRLDGEDAAPSETVTVEITLDEEGRWRFANLSPGRYRVQLKDFYPARSDITPRSPEADYLHRRYGLANPVWQDTRQDNLVVRAGSQVSLQPWRLVARPHP